MYWKNMNKFKKILFSVLLYNSTLNLIGCEQPTKQIKVIAESIWKNTL